MLKSPQKTQKVFSKNSICDKTTTLFRVFCAA